MMFLLITTIIVLWLFYEFNYKRRNYPPGPIPVPFVGNIIPFIWDKPGYECFRKWTKKYGDVYTFWLGPSPYVIIGSYELMKETFVKDGDTYTDKLQQPFTEKFRGGKFGIIETSGHFWSTHRRFALSTFRNFGLGKDLMQQKILLEIEEFFKVVDRNIGEEQDVPKEIYNTVANVINQLVFGYRFDEEKQEEFQKLKDLIDIQEKSFTSFKYCIQAFAPEVQEKIHMDLDRVIRDDNRLVTTADKNELPYINAVINESQRCVNLLPLNLFHATTKDTVINGYPVKKGTGVIAQISTVMLDEKVFPDPYSFNPDRFIDEEGKLKKIDELIPFSIGKRQCLGEGLARMELFLFIANFFNRYQVLPSATGPPSLEKAEMVGVFPRKFDAVLKRRNVE
ncbi:unnamed protein product [Caenorhabditis nigoni]